MTPTKCRAVKAKSPYGRLRCVLDTCHRGDHENANHIKWKNLGKRLPAKQPKITASDGIQWNSGVIRKIPTRGFLLKITEWKELRRRIDRVLWNYRDVPDLPPWPPGSTGSSAQKLRKLLQDLDARFERKE